ncbi:putative subtilase, partial [Colletotrichum sublineola]
RPIPYIIVTKKLTRQAGTALQDRIRSYVLGPIEVDVREDNEEDPQEMVFSLKTTEKLVKDLEALNDGDIDFIFPESNMEDENFESSNPDEGTKPPIHADPESVSQGVLFDSGADTSLKTLSQPPELSSYHPDDMPGYAYPASSGKGITIYIIDTGANPTHEEYTGSPGLKRWIFVREGDTSESDSAPDEGHGTCIQSLVNGPRFGAAKDADIVIVKIPHPMLASDLTKALYWVTDDIQKRKLEGKAVVTISSLARLQNVKKHRGFGTKGRSKGQDEAAESWKTKIDSLLSLDVPVVVASGSLRKENEHIDSFPGAFAKELDIITVGAMEPNGRRTDYSQGDIDEVTVLTIGEVQCARKDSTSETMHASGTSLTAPRVAAMIATWMSSDQYRERLQVKGKVAANIKALLKELAYVRLPASERDGGFPVAYNGFGMFTCSDHSNGKRAEDGSSCRLNNTSPTTTTALPSATPTTSTAIKAATPAPVPKPVPKPKAPPSGTALYMIKGYTPGKTTECFPGGFDLDGRTNFVYQFTLDSLEASVTFRRSFLPGSYMFRDSGWSGNGKFDMSSEDGRFWACLTNDGDKDANLQVNIY